MRRRIAALLLLIFAVSSLSGCSKQDSFYETSFFAMDTVVTLRLSRRSETGGRLAESVLRTAAAEAEKIVRSIEQSISRTDENSETARLNRSMDGIVSSDADFLAVLSRALEIADATNGTYSPAIGTLTELWDIPGGGHLPSETELSEALSHTDYRALSVTGDTVSKSDSALLADLGGIGKGYAAQRLTAYLDTTEIACGLVSLGGNIGVFGEKKSGEPYKIGVSDPRGSSLAGYLYITKGYVSVSGDYERCFFLDGVRYHHIFDPADGYPASEGIISAAVLSRDGTLADALSTALFVMGVEKALAYYEAHPGEFEAILITEQGEIVLTPGLAAAGTFNLNGDQYTLIP